MMYNFILNSPIGNLGFKLKNNMIYKVAFLLDKDIDKDDSSPASSVKLVKTKLDHYFKHKSQSIDLPFTLEGTPFQQKVWQRMSKIPYGETMTYGELAKELNTSAQAVGNACRANPVPLLVPCHRILGANNKGGFAGATEGPLYDIKLWLLKHEMQRV